MIARAVPPTASTTIETTMTSFVVLFFEPGRTAKEGYNLQKNLVKKSCGYPPAGLPTNVTSWRADTILKGDPDGAVSYAWSAWVTDGSGKRIFELVTDGLSTPNVEDHLLLFLKPEDRVDASFFGEVSHQPVNGSGVAFVEDGVVTKAREGDRGAASELQGMSADEIGRRIDPLVLAAGLSERFMWARCVVPVAAHLCRVRGRTPCFDRVVGQTPPGSQSGLVSSATTCNSL